MDEYPVEEATFEDSVKALVRMSHRILRELGPTHSLYQMFSDRIASVETWYENDDPRANGWVGSDGQP